MANPVLTDVAGIGEAGAAKLRRAGLASVRALAEAPLTEIEAVPGFGRATAGRAKRSARTLVGPAAAGSSASGTRREQPAAPPGRDDPSKKAKKHEKSKNAEKGKKSKKDKKGKGKKSKKDKKGKKGKKGKKSKKA